MTLCTTLFTVVNKNYFYTVDSRKVALIFFFFIAIVVIVQIPKVHAFPSGAPPSPAPPQILLLIGITTGDLLGSQMRRWRGLLFHIPSSGSGPHGVCAGSDVVVGFWLL